MYCDYSDITAALDAKKALELVDKDRDGVRDANVFERAAAEADELIDSRLRPRYAVPPVDEQAEAVRGIATWIVIYRLSTGVLADDDRTERYRQAVSQLNALRDGRADLPDTPRRTGGRISVTSAPRRLGRDAFGLD